MTRRTRRAVLAAALMSLTMAIHAPANAQQGEVRGSMAAHYGDASSARPAIPAVLNEDDRDYYRQVFAAIDAEEWDEATSLLEEREAGPLHQIALAELYTHANSPRVSAEEIAQWFQYGSELPQAEQLSILGSRRGLDRIPSLPEAQRFSRQPGITRRTRPRSIDDGTISDRSRAAILDAIRTDDPQGALEILQDIDPELSDEARAEWRQRVAWSFYIENDDVSSLALAQTVSEGSGAWVAEGEWVAGLASWRLGSCSDAADFFARAARVSTNVELTSAAHYWAHRALIRCREPGLAQQHLAAAATYEETLYGLLATDQLGINWPQSTRPTNFLSSDWNVVSNRQNVRVATALVEIGRVALADEVLRHEVRIGNPRNYTSIAALARELGLPSTQLFMAYNAPYGVRSDRQLRFPVARWQPVTGWRVDPALAFAHALQESSFRTAAVSPANARGLMQITPITVREHAPRLNMRASYVDLNDPEVNLAFGQRNLEMLRDSPVTGGLLPKIMAAYNAGLTPVERWNNEIRDFGDPLLWMESIPYWETRGYVAIVMRNYWMYERAAGIPSPSRRALAQGRWPEFPRRISAATLSADW